MELLQAREIIDAYKNGKSRPALVKEYGITFYYLNRIIVESGFIKRPKVIWHKNDTHKNCACCKQMKLVSDFTKDKTRRSGLSPYCRVCEKIRSNAVYCRNIDVNRKKRAEYGKENRQLMLELSRRWYKLNKKRVQDNVAKYRTLHPEMQKEAYLKYRRNNPEKVRESSRRYFETPNGKLARRQVNHLRKARQRAAGSHTYLQWEELKVKYNFTCVMCNKAEPEIKLTRDHIVPVSKGGSSNIDNIQPLCGSCNSKKGNR